MMKKIFLLFAVICAGCASTSDAVHYRFSDSAELNTFQIRTVSSWGIDKILIINGVHQDTITGMSGFKTTDSKVSTWNGKKVEFSAVFKYYVLWSDVYCRVKVNNEIIIDEMK